MSTALEDYAMIGDCRTAALIGRDGSIDWWCWPDFECSSTFTALLGGPEHGRWLIAPASRRRATTSAYRGTSLILETRIATDDGEVAVTDFMTAGDQRRALVRMVEGISGRVEMRSEFAPRGHYGRDSMFFGATPNGIHARGGMLDLLVVVRSDDAPGRPNSVIQDSRAYTSIAVGSGQRAVFILGDSKNGDWLAALDPRQAIEETARFWQNWSKQSILATTPIAARSLTVLKAMAHPLGGIIAAPTTSLPQWLGGLRNWDYRYCWLRDSALVASVFARTGHAREAVAWRDWLLRVAPEDLRQLQPVYGLSGHRELAEIEMPWLPGYEGSRPVRAGNAAYRQSQLDGLGWVMTALSDLRNASADDPTTGWVFERALADHVIGVWQHPDHGVWEMRGDPQHFTDSKVMAWVALDRAIRSAESWGLDAPLDGWRTAREEIHREVCDRAYNRSLGTFVQAYDSSLLDSNLLMMPLTGFLPVSDERVLQTIHAIEEVLMQDGLLRRYDARVDDGLPPGQGAFLPCTFWLVECMALMGRQVDARALFERVAALANELGLLSEQYDAAAGRLTGNFPQGFTHVSLVNAALRL